MKHLKNKKCINLGKTVNTNANSKVLLLRIWSFCASWIPVFEWSKANIFSVENIRFIRSSLKWMSKSGTHFYQKHYKVNALNANVVIVENPKSDFKIILVWFHPIHPDLISSRPSLIPAIPVWFHPDLRSINLWFLNYDFDLMKIWKFSLSLLKWILSLLFQ